MIESSKVKTIVASLVILGSLLFLYGFFHVSPPGPEPRMHEGLGRVLAQQAAQLVGPGGRITLITRDTSIAKSPATDLQVKAFCRALQEAKLSVAFTNLVKLDPDRLARVPPGDFYELMRKQSENDVIVSLLGPPVLSAVQQAKLGDKHPRVVAVCSGFLPRQVNLRDQFEEHLISVAILSRESPAMVLPQSDDPQTWFNHFFQIMTSSNLADLPLPIRAPTL